MGKRIVLATNSPIKISILKRSKLNFVTAPSDIDESQFDNLPIADIVKKLSYEKCEDVAIRYPKNIVIAADTLAVDPKGRESSKPKGLEEAFDMAIKLSGKMIQVYTGVTLHLPPGELFTELALTRVRYQKFTKSELKRLFEGDDPTIRFSGLGIFFEAPGFTLIESFEGSYTGAFGLPMEIVYKYLRKWKVV